jgi:hypothetical protein
MDAISTPVRQINESSLLQGNATGDGEVLGLPLAWVETHRALSLLLALGCCSLASLLAIVNIRQHLQHYSRPQLQRYIVRILVIVPVYAIGSLLSLKFVKQALYFDTLRDIYEAFVVYSFLALVLSFCGGESVCVLKMQSEPDIPHAWPLSVCFPPMGRDGRLLRFCKRATLQFVLVKPVFALLSLLMLACGTYHTLFYQLLLAVVYNISYSLALYGLWLFYLATRHILQPFHPVMKFLAVKLVVFLTFWQNGLIDFVPGITNEQSFAWKDFILCLEMVPFSILHLIAFNSNQFKKNLDALPDSEVLKNMKEVLSLTDILADAYHNFMPSYRDYMLQRNGGGGDTARGRGRSGTFTFGDDGSTGNSSSEGSPTPMAHANARAPRFVIDDEDDDEMDEGVDLEKGEAKANVGNKPSDAASVQKDTDVLKKEKDVSVDKDDSASGPTVPARDKANPQEDDDVVDETERSVTEKISEAEEEVEQEPVTERRRRRTGSVEDLEAGAGDDASNAASSDHEGCEDADGAASSTTAIKPGEDHDHVV